MRILAIVYSLIVDTMAYGWAVNTSLIGLHCYNLLLLLKMTQMPIISSFPWLEYGDSIEFDFGRRRIEFKPGEGKKRNR